MKFGKFALTMVFALAAAATQAQSTITYAWVETGSSFGDGFGTVTVDYTSTLLDSDGSLNSYVGYDFTVTGSTGTFNGHTITGLNRSGNFINFQEGSDTAPATPEPADSNNLSINFTAGDQYDFNAGFTPGLTIFNTTSSPSSSDNNAGTFTLSPEPAPEPTTLALAGLGLTGLIAARRRK